MGESKENQPKLKPYLSPAGAWAFSIGTSIGWGSFVITGNTYLVKAGPLGSVFGLLIGAAVMMIIAYNYHFMTIRCPEAGGAYSFCKTAFGFDYGFLTAWFLGLTYISVFWANITSLPLFSRYFFGDRLQIGFRYTVFGYQISLSEILLCIIAILLTGFICSHSRKIVSIIMILLAVDFTVTIIVCFVVSFVKAGGASTINPGYVPERSEVAQIIRIACISLWAFIGFENISNSAEEFKFKTNKLFKILIVSIVFTTLL
ncbi:MAG: amino acid permease, partial [Lachnospiraceae bacterium]|nr:amino acid permease [Lachnospiraceae bacterium]